MNQYWLKKAVKDKSYTRDSLPKLMHDSEILLPYAIVFYDTSFDYSHRPGTYLLLMTPNGSLLSAREAYFYTAHCVGKRVVV